MTISSPKRWTNDGQRHNPGKISESCFRKGLRRDKWRTVLCISWSETIKSKDECFFFWLIAFNCSIVVSVCWWSLLLNHHLKLLIGPNQLQNINTQSAWLKFQQLKNRLLTRIACTKMLYILEHSTGKHVTYSQIRPEQLRASTQRLAICLHPIPNLPCIKYNQWKSSLWGVNSLLPGHPISPHPYWPSYNDSIYTADTNQLMFRLKATPVIFDVETHLAIKLHKYDILFQIV